MKWIKASLLFSSVAFSIGARAKLTTMAGHVPYAAMVDSLNVGQLAPSKTMTLTISLNLRNELALQTLINRLYNPNDSLYRHYLTTQQFRAEFGPTQQDVAQVAQYLQSHNLQIVGETTSTLEVQGRASEVEKTFGVHLNQYLRPDGRFAFAPDSEPQLDSAIAPKIAGIIGLNSFAHYEPLSLRRLHRGPIVANSSTPPPSGSGLGPADIQSAYHLQTAGTTGAGQTLALMELDGYAPTDIATYAQSYGITPVPLQNILIDGYNGSAGQGAPEVVLDIELMMAVAPGAAKILVYEGVNNENGPVDVYGKIADDNIAKQVSTSWGSPESQNTAAYLNSENKIFMQMAAQGQSIYAASGDSGAYDDGSTLSVDDPASQPYIVATGGTTLTTAANGAYSNETSWSVANSEQQGQPEGGGGGISSVWKIPTWQTGLASTANQGSSTMRMVPDIAFDADPNTGYAIYQGGAWNEYGGTSCAAPIWAAYTALVNQARAKNGLTTLGFADPVIYQLGKGAGATLFHDIADSSTNLFYPAVTGYDLSTGWGTPVGPQLFSALSAKK